MTTFVPVPGMWLGAWAWRSVTERLRTAGHDVYPVTLTGLGDRAHLAGPDTDLDTHITDLVNTVRYADLRDVVLVAHSYGCVPVRGAVDRLAGRVARVAYVDSGPLPDGAAQFDMNTPEAQVGIRRQVGDGYLIPPPPWNSADDPVNLAGLDDDALALLRRLSVGHPFATATGALRLSGAPQPPTTLITCTFPVDQVHAMIAAGHPFFSGVQRDNLDVRALPTGHWPMLSEPAALADLLSSIRDSAA
jgi:pimeloyl-ACP methyl ester carboxylesterase